MSVRPPVIPWATPQALSNYPEWPHAPSGILVEGHASWRQALPQIDNTQCKKCLQCYLLCPDAAISVSEDNKFVIDLELCKGCGVCIRECLFEAIRWSEEKK